MKRAVLSPELRVDTICGLAMEMARVTGKVVQVGVHDLDEDVLAAAVALGGERRHADHSGWQWDVVEFGLDRARISLYGLQTRLVPSPPAAEDAEDLL